MTIRRGTGLPMAARKPRRPRAEPEFQMQAALFTWARIPSVLAQHPALALLEGSMNGVRLTAAQAGKAKAAGMLKGSHDIRLPVARGEHIGLSIELKAGKNKPSEEQIDYGIRLTAEGWMVAYVWDDWTEVKAIILGYLSRDFSFCRNPPGAEIKPAAGNRVEYQRRDRVAPDKIVSSTVFPAT
jgi:hypothetical protein